jgi:hypothetical protein
MERVFIKSIPASILHNIRFVLIKVTIHRSGPQSLKVNNHNCNYFAECHQKSVNITISTICHIMTCRIKDYKLPTTASHPNIINFQHYCILTLIPT